MHIRNTILLTFLATTTLFGDTSPTATPPARHIQRGLKLPKIKDLFDRFLDKMKEKLNLVKPPKEVEATAEELDKMQELVDTTLEEIPLDPKKSKKEAEKNRIVEACSRLIPYLKSDELTDGEKTALYNLIKKLMKKI
jgi:molecular chaperone DnaK (HSP70)